MRKERAGIFAVELRNEDFVPQREGAARGRIQKDLVVPLGQTAFGHRYQIHFFRQGIKADDLVVLQEGDEGVVLLRAFRRHDPRLPFELFGGVFLQAEGRDQLEIEEDGLLQIVVRRQDDRVPRAPQARKKAGPQHNDSQDGQISSRRPKDRPERILAERGLAFYHSISSMGMGFSFSSTALTVPFLTRTTRSAIAVRALLWVMMITVIPVSRPVSARSFRMALPVS